MLGKIYSLLFVLLIFSLLWFQRRYLSVSTKEFTAQLTSGNSILPVLSAQNYKSISFEDGIVKSSFLGQNLIYYSNSHFEAKGNLMYEESPSSHTRFSLQNNFVLKTESAFGEFVGNSSRLNASFLKKNKLKRVYFPELVNFSFQNNKGQSRHVELDVNKNILQSKDFIEAHGPDGDIHGVGFSYSISQGDFILNSKVHGQINPNQLTQK